MIEAVVFDMDGTLIDSRELIYTAFEAVLRANNVTKTRQEIAAVTGIPVQPMYKLLAPHLDPVHLEAAHYAHNEANLHLIKPYDGVQHTLQTLKDAGLKLAIFTGFNATTHNRLRDHGIDHYFDFVSETTRYKKHKPDPEGLFLALSELGVDSPKKAIYIGDAPIDMLAGKNAGVYKTIGISHGFASARELEAAEADMVVHSLAELTERVLELHHDA